MRILVYPHDFAIGGSQINAIELAARTRDQGHEVVLYGRPGPLLSKVAELGLEFISAPEPRLRPSPATVRDLTFIVRNRGIDVLHGYEWPPGVECSLAARLTSATAVTTVLSMSVVPFLPTSVPLVVGTEQIAARERARGRSMVSCIEPPVDVRENRPGAGAEADPLPDWQPDDRGVVVCVTRLVPELKLEGLLTAMEAMVPVNARTPARLVLVGDGRARDQLEAKAEEVNRRVGPGTVVLTGELFDPRQAYDVADVVIGMGGSALRALAFEKPLIVQGERGYFKILNETTRSEFEWAGWYGWGSEQEPWQGLADMLVGLLDSPAERERLGRFGRALVEERYSLETAVARQVDVYEGARGGPVDHRGDADAAAAFVLHRLRSKLGRWRGGRAIDDSNIRPVVADGPAQPVGMPRIASSSSARRAQL